jgi:hypothetical protein
MMRIAMYALECLVVTVPCAAQRGDDVDGRPCSGRGGG